LRDERGFTGGITIVKDYVALQRQRSQEMFVPLAHPPGHAQVVMSLPPSCRQAGADRREGFSRRWWGVPRRFQQFMLIGFVTN
jgi:hypothetical protein